jgi:hypothetical protein
MAVTACGRSLPPPADPPVARRSADEIIAVARLSPEAAPRVAFEIHRLDAFAACSAAQARLEGRARVRASSGGGASAGLIGGIVIGGLGLVGGIVTTALAASIKAPPLPKAPPPPGAELPGVEGKTGVIVAGVLTGVAVVGAAVITVLISGRGDDDDEKKQSGSLVPGGVGPVGGQVGSTLGQAGGALGRVGAGVVGQTGIDVGVQAGGIGGQAGLGVGGQAGASVSVQPAVTRGDIATRINAFQSECPDDPAESALQACTDKARVLRLACSAGR